MRNLVVLFTLISGPMAYAHVDCAGEMNSGSIVHVAINTGGPMGVALGGFVSAKATDGKISQYAIKTGDIAQYFEDSEDPANTWVGAQIYIDGANPVNLKYRGTNYLQRDLTEVLREKGRPKQAGNAMRVWKGPGYNAEEQYSFHDVVCSSFVDQ